GPNAARAPRRHVAHLPRRGAADGRPGPRLDRERELRARPLRRRAARPLLRRQGRDRGPHEGARARAGPARGARQLRRARRDRHGPPDRHVAHAGVPGVAPAAAALDAGGDRGDHRLRRVGRRLVPDRRGRLAQLGGGGVRVALVTGAATGIGQATADVLEAHGFTVARNHLPGQAVRGYSAAADVSNPAAVDRMVRDVTRDLGPVSVLVANAAYMVMGGIDEVGAGEFWRVVNTNLTG